MNHDRLRDQARAYYEAKLLTHGPTPRGADWNSGASQELRFRQLERLWEDDPHASLLDYGCGYGALAAYVRGRGHRGPYIGFDLSDAMAATALNYLAPFADCSVTSDRKALSPADFAVASGVLNVKQDADDRTWQAYAWETIADLDRIGTKGFAFNALTLHSDPEKRRPDLYYADPLDVFEHCRRLYSRFVALLHDYPLYEFTIIVRR